MVRVVVPETDVAEKLCAIERAAFAGREAFWTVADYIALGSPPQAAILTDDAVTQGLLVLRFAVDEGEILNLGVVPQARRKGFGRELMKAGEALAGSLGIARMFLEVATDNLPARRLYESLGYGQVGERPGYYARPDGTRINAIILSRPLRRDADL